MECLVVHLRDELLATEWVIVGWVLQECGNVGLESFEVLSGHVLSHHCLFELWDVLILEVGLNQQKERWSLIAQLVVHDLLASPWGLADVVGVVLLLVCELVPGIGDVSHGYIRISAYILRKVSSFGVVLCQKLSSLQFDALSDLSQDSNRHHCYFGQRFHYKLYN